MRIKRRSDEGKEEDDDPIQVAKLMLKARSRVNEAGMMSN
jgi:hypothetical protein